VDFAIEARPKMARRRERYGISVFSESLRGAIMAEQHLPAHIRYLLDPSAYPHGAARIDLIQTHISYVLLAGDYVYKIKKPVNFGFLDFTTLEKRQFYCNQELLLNRRLCPSLYLGLVAITGENGGFRLDGNGPAVEYAVKMRRMPEERMMSRLIDQGQLPAEAVDRIVDILVPFYEQAAAGPEIRAYGRAEAVGVNIRENFTQTETFIGSNALNKEQFAAIRKYALDFLSEEQLFDERIAAGRIRDCHGDLYSANICIADEIFIYDCIEFNTRFRYTDVASDVAFLAMDLDFHGLTTLSARFIERFIAASGDRGLQNMLDFYKCYRAYVRGKIGLFTAHAPEVDNATREKCLGQAGRYFALAAHYAGKN